jgi:hypothetical protein
VSAARCPAHARAAKTLFDPLAIRLLPCCGQATSFRNCAPSALATDLTERSRGSIATHAILQALRRSRYIEGQNLLIEPYFGEGRASHDPDLARDVVRRNPDLIIAIGNKLVLDLKAATSTVPIVGVFGQPVEEGIVGSLARRAAISLGSLTVLVGAVGKAGPIVEANGTAGHPIGDR